MTYYTYLADDERHAPVLLIPGFASPGLQVWHTTGWIKKLNAAGFSCYVFDLPYHTPENVDESASPGAQLPARSTLQVTGQELYSGISESLAGFIESLSTQAHVVGFSAGARIAWELASTHSDVVKSLTVGGLPPHSEFGDLREYLSSVVGGTPHVPASLNPMFVQLVEQTPISAHALEHFVNLPQHFDFDPSVMTPQCPTIVVAGTADTVSGSPAWLTHALETQQVPHQELLVEGRNHINTLTSGVFKKAVIDWASTAE